MTQPSGAVLPQQFIDLMLAEVRRGSPAGYEFFYGFVMNMVLPNHGKVWIEKIWKWWKEGDPVLLEAFRGSTKTTIVTNVFSAYLHGLYPEKTGLIIQAGENSGLKNSAKVSEIIESNDGFKQCFPWVVPDKARGWSSTGYNIMDNRVPYGDWVRQLSKDPSFVGYGYKSSSIIGMHPSLYLIVDDIHDEENTRSDIEIEHVKTTWGGTISPTRKPHNPLVVFPFTPWKTNDLYADLKATGAYKHIRTPVEVEGNWVWPEAVDAKEMARIEKEDITGGVETARMYYLDLEAMKKRVYQYQTFPSEMLRHEWPVTGGLDYASVADPTKRNQTQSHMALADLVQTPENLAVVLGGELEQCGMFESLELVKKHQETYPNWQGCGIEGDGKGEDFFQLCAQAPGLRVTMKKTGGRSKADRQVNDIGFWLKNGKLRVSDAQTPFLNALRQFLNKYPNVGTHDPGWDCMDAIWQAMQKMQVVFQMQSEQGDSWIPGRKKRSVSPLNSLGSQHAYS